MNKELRVIENELVPVYETSTGEKVVYGSELYKCIGSKQEYSHWIKNRLKECDSIENEDFTIILSESTGGRPKNEYVIKLDTAKEMAMLERNEKGKQVRRYFIKIEKKYKEQAAKPLSAIEQLRLQSQAIMEVDEKVEAINRDLQEFKQEMPILGIEIDKITEEVHKRGVNALGGKETNAYNNRSLRGKVYSDIYRELKRQFGVSSYKAIKRNQCELAISIINEYELPFVLADQIKDCNAQITMGVA